MSGRRSVACLACLLMWPLAAGADIVGVVPDWKMQPERSDTVTTRERPELEPPGLPFEGYYLYPKFSFTSLHTDNVFATVDDRESDQVRVYSPELALSSDWNRHGFTLAGGADLGRYSEFSTEDYDDLRLAANGWLDSSKNSRLSAGVTSAELHEPRESPDDANGLNPVQFDLDTAFVTFEHREGRYSFIPSIDYNEYDYQDVKAVPGGFRQVIDQDFRDRSEYNLDLYGAYEIGSKHDIFARLRLNERDYDNLQPVFGLERSSKGRELGVGMHYDLGGITHGRIYLGRHLQQYDSPLPDIDTPVYDFLLAVNITSLTTVEIRTGRSILETTSLFDSGIVSSRRSFRIDHELLRNLFIYFEYSRIADDYESIEDFLNIDSIDQDDLTESSNAGVKYIPNRYWVLSFQIEQTERDSTTVLNLLEDGSSIRIRNREDFEENIYWFRIEARL